MIDRLDSGKRESARKIEVRDATYEHILQGVLRQPAVEENRYEKVSHGRIQKLKNGTFKVLFPFLFLPLAVRSRVIGKIRARTVCSDVCVWVGGDELFLKTHAERPRETCGGGTERNVVFFVAALSPHDDGYSVLVAREIVWLLFLLRGGFVYSSLFLTFE